MLFVVLFHEFDINCFFRIKTMCSEYVSNQLACGCFTKTQLYLLNLGIVDDASMEQLHLE